MTHEDSKEMLLKSALAVFSESGFDGATVKDISDRAKLNVSLVSYYFDGKEGIYRACLEKIGREEFAAANRILQDANSEDEFKTRFRMFTEEFMHVHLQNMKICKIILRDFENGNPTTRDVFKKSFLPTFEKMMKFIEAAQKKGFVRSDIDSEDATALMFGSIVHAIRMDPLRKMVFGDSITDEKVKNRFIDNFLKINFSGILRSFQ